MNKLIEQMGGLLDMTHSVRDQALALVGESDMSFTLDGCPPVGDLIRLMGDAEQAYTDAFGSRKVDWTTRAAGRDEVSSGTSAIEWFATLDAALKESIAAVPVADLDAPVDRGGWTYPVSAHFHTYREAVLIFFGKFDVYLRVLGKERPAEWQGWVG